MKKIYTIVILLSLGITQIYAQSQCFNCDSTTKAFTIGSYTTATGANSFAGGNDSGTSADNSFVFGNESTVLGVRGIALGNAAKVNHTDGIAIGSTVTSSAANAYLFGQNLYSGVANSITIGLGTASNSLLSNTKAGSIMFGVTHTPSLTIAKPANANIGFLGIGTTEPKQLVHINDGNLLISATSASTKNIIQMGEGLYNWNIERLNSQADGYGLNFWVDDFANPGGGEQPRSSNSVFFLSTNDRVGIGTKTPTAKLDVAGGFKATKAEITQTLTTNDLTAQSATIALLTGITTAENLRVENLLCAQEVKVQISTCWPDFVFGKNYKLMPLQELEQFVNENQHLPEIPSAATVEENGIELGQMNTLLLKKIEELTLYIFDLQKQIDELKK